jgi:uncharacterized protein YqfA (UPF0365 family)
MKLKVIFIYLFLISTLYAVAQTGEAPPTDSSTVPWSVGILVFLLVAVVGIGFYFMGFALSIRALISGVKIGLHQVTFMRLKNVPPNKIILAMIQAAEAGIKLDTKRVVAHHLAGGDIENVIEAIIAAKNADNEIDKPEDKLGLTFDIAASIDLAKFDVVKAVYDSIHYKVMETEPIRAYAMDGVELTMKCKATIRYKIKKIVGGISSETVLARINEGIATEVGRTESHHSVLQNPYKVADKVESDPALFEDTGYEVRSIDISDIEVGKDIHAELQKERADAAKEEAAAQHAVARVKEQEMKAKAQESKVRLIDAETEVQKAMAAAFLDGNLSVHDYHEMMNTEADTKMREALSKSNEKNGH